MSVKDDEEGNINSILLEIGVPGRYQWHVFFWTFVVGIVTAFQTVAPPFTQGDMAYRCSDIGGDTTPVMYNDSMMYNDDTFNNTCTLPTNNSSDECADFDYDQSIFHSTVISKFDLVCSRAVYITVSNMAYNAASIPCGIISGLLSDRFGRRTTIIAHLTVIGIIGVTTAFSASIEMYIALRVLMSMPTTGVYDSSNTLLSEITSPVKRPHVLIGSVMSWSISICMVTGLAYWLTDWFYLQIAISVPALVLAVIAYWAYDESPHWLYSKSRFNEAQKVIDKMAEQNNCLDCNITITAPNANANHEDQKFHPSHLDDKREGKTDVPVTFSSNDENEMASTNGCIQILASPSFIAVICVCALGWLSCNLGYYGLLLGIGSLVGDLYVNSIIGGLVELVAYNLCFLILKGGRKKIYVGLLLIGGVGLISSGIVSTYLPGTAWLIITLTMIGRLCISAAWQVLYVWCLELFPTSVRVTMLQIALTSGYAGAVIGPLLADIHKLVTDPNIKATIIAPITYSVLLLLSGLASLYLPETNNRPLPVTISDALAANQRKATSDDSIELKDHQARL